jgi:protein-tyrosine phosphatase
MAESAAFMIRNILFVCLGNICRSPLVEVVARKRLGDAGLAIDVASCGTGGWHAGEAADPRMREAAAAAGYDLGRHRARQLRSTDWDRHDLILVMDQDNFIETQRALDIASSERLALFLAWSGITSPLEFPDPYYGERSGFTDAVFLAEQGVQGMIERLRHG